MSERPRLTRVPTIEEKRVYADKEDAAEVYVASDVGLVVASVSDDIVGEFGLEYRGDVRDVALVGGRLVVAGDDVYLGDFTPTEFGPAVAVGGDANGRIVAAGDDGRVARYDAESGDWQTVGELDGVRAIDGGLVAAADGVYRVGAGLSHAGLDDVHDVAGEGVPLAATGDGLYRLGNGWMDCLDGDFRVVASDGERAHAATETTLFECERTGEWAGVDVAGADGPLADVGYTAAAVVAVTETGTLLVDSEGQADDAGDGWRSRSLGVRGVSALAVRER